MAEKIVSPSGIPLARCYAPFSKETILRDNLRLVNKKAGIMFALPLQYIQI